MASLHQRLRGYRLARDAKPSIRRGAIQRMRSSQSRYGRLLPESTPKHPYCYFRQQIQSSWVG